MNLLLVLIGLVGGAVLTSFLLKGQTRPSMSEADTDVAALRGKLLEKDATLTEMRQTIDAERQIASRLHQQVGEAMAARAKAEERASMTARLETQLAEKEATLDRVYDELANHKVRLASLMTRLDEAEKAQADKLRAMEETQAKMGERFRATAAEALAANNQSFLDLARTALQTAQVSGDGDVELRKQALGQLVEPLKESLHKVDRHILDLEKERAAAYAGLSEQVRTMSETQSRLQAETTNLVRALRAPDVKGRWGEMQLRRVVEMAGMLEYCDFVQQETLEGSGGKLRPDLIVKLPNNRQVVVDAKVSLRAYLVSLELSDEQARKAKLIEHAQQIRAHLTRLGSKAYWDQLSTTPDFVVAFLPGEVFFSAALEADPELIEFGVQNRVLLATPTTLIALLKAVSHGWRQEGIARNAQEISDLGKQLYDRLANLTSYFDELRKSLERSVGAYNRAAGNLESRVLVSARRFKELSAAAGEDLPVCEPVSHMPRSLMAQNGKGTPVEEPEAAKTGEELLADIEQATTEVIERAEANGALGTLATAVAD
jgi:DNA recombination protein RmuC